MSSITYVGLDVHKRTIAVAMLCPTTGEVNQWEVTHEPTALRRFIRKLKAYAPLRCVYEAGPTGYGRQRQLQAAGIARADRAQQRLCRQYRLMTGKGKHHNTIVVAIARMLIGYVWETLREAQPSAA